MKKFFLIQIITTTRIYKAEGADPLDAFNRWEKDLEEDRAIFLKEKKIGMHQTVEIIE